MKRKNELNRLLYLSFMLFALLMGISTFENEVGEPSYIVGRGSQTAQHTNTTNDDLYIVGYGNKSNQPNTQPQETMFIVGRGLVNSEQQSHEQNNNGPSFIIGRGRVY